ncbi:hypothetical protein FDG2_3315 [Candidatus Protofrankia californiensis]|uniref:Uncharacterized protein n=1 Tax=Candidatus Protofrankia californiensis TaxID=1839754 RepID=A0A1C3NZE9_9ACTN|nr:hypothetical protein FDG2_3315 [Candidatus Protofrankia californiensis]
MIIDEEPGGAATVTRWIRDLYGREPGHSLWVVLDDPLRLALAQGWVLGELGLRDDDLAEDLAADDSNNRRFGEMLAALAEHWRSVYSTLRHDAGLLKAVNVAGAGMELVVMTAPEHIGRYPEGATIPAHSFVTRLEADEWVIAALARRLPVPGWPPSEQNVPGLEIDV